MRSVCASRLAAGLAARAALPNATFPIAGIGAPAGGLDVLRMVFSNMPSDSFTAFVVVLHLLANRRSLPPDILSRWTRMTVRPVEYSDPVEASTVYVPPPHAGTVLCYGRLHLGAMATDAGRTTARSTVSSTRSPQAIGSVPC